jgi:hypothetical protein
LFLNNVFSQLKEEAISVSQHVLVSHVVEALVREAAPAHILTLCTAFSTDWDTACMDKFASHVLQRIVSVLPKCFNCAPPTGLGSLQGQGSLQCQGSQEESDAAVELFESLCGHLVASVEACMAAVYGSHVLRVVLEVLAGSSVGPQVIRSRLSRDNKKGISLSLSLSLSRSLFHAPSPRDKPEIMVGGRKENGSLYDTKSEMVSGEIVHTRLHLVRVCVFITTSRT